MLTPEEKNTLYNIMCNQARDMLDQDIYPFAIMVMREDEGTARAGFMKATPNMDDETVVFLLEAVSENAKRDLETKGKLSVDFFININMAPPQKPSMN